MRLASVREPFNHPDWVSTTASVRLRMSARAECVWCRGICTPISRSPIGDAIATELSGRSAVIDGEIVCLDASGRPQFYDLLRRRQPVHLYAFDLLELDGEDLRNRTLIERKEALRKLIGPQCRRLLYVDHMDGRGVDLFRLACENDLEGIVAKWKYGAYVCGDEQPPDRRIALHAHNPAAAARLTWLKIKNPSYSQMEGRDELFKLRAAVR